MAPRVNWLPGDHAAEAWEVDADLEQCVQFYTRLIATVAG